MRLKRNKKELKSIRSKLRQNMPSPEVILWQKLRNKQLGIKFRRQYSIENYILDFYAPKIKLGIEIDGESHFIDEEKRKRDKIRDQKLIERGIKILRFLNPDVMKNIDGVLIKIREEANKGTPS